MKANQKFMEADNAVSPVIGVILMVAITVVLAAVVFVLVSDLGGGGGDTQPAMSWQVSQAEGTATVSAADPGAEWSEFEIRFDVAGQLDGDAVSSLITWGADPAAGEYASLTGGTIGGGDKLYFCTDTTAGEITATLRHIDSNSIAREFTFSNAPECPNGP